MQKEYYRREYLVKTVTKWYWIFKDDDCTSLENTRIRLKALREQSRGLFVYRLVKRIYLDELLEEA